MYRELKKCEYCTLAKHSFIPFHTYSLVQPNSNLWDSLPAECFPWCQNDFDHFTFYIKLVTKIFCISFANLVSACPLYSIPTPMWRPCLSTWTLMMY